MNKFAADIIILHMCTKNHNHIMYGSWDTEWDRQNFLSFWTIFCPFALYKNQNFNIEKNTWRYYHFTHLHHKWQSCDVWFLSYGVQWTEFFIILDCFLLFYPPKQPKKSKFWKNEKNGMDILSFYTGVTQMTIIWCMVPEIPSTTDTIFRHFGPFFALLPLNNPKNQNLTKWEKCLEILSFYTSVP